MNRAMGECQWQTHREGTARSDTRRTHLNRSALCLSQLADQRKTDTQAFPVVGGVLLFGLTKEVEHMIEVLGRNAGTIVFDIQPSHVPHLAGD
ncbi:hypothetical protein D3C85_1402610 [compost metagenome]